MGFFDEEDRAAGITPPSVTVPQDLRVQAAPTVAQEQASIAAQAPRMAADFGIAAGDTLTFGVAPHLLGAEADVEAARRRSPGATFAGDIAGSLPFNRMQLGARIASGLGAESIPLARNIWNVPAKMAGY